MIINSMCIFLNQIWLMLGEKVLFIESLCYADIILMNINY